MSELIQIQESIDSKRKAEGIRLSVQQPTRKREPGPRPDWLKVTYRRNDAFEIVNTIKRELNLVTVCEEARCPNIDECWSAGTATFMLMGDICTRHCGFCAVTKGKPKGLDPLEPQNTAQAILRLGVKHAVITSVNRDELPDGGAAHFAATVTAIKRISPDTRIELLVPDFMGDRESLAVVLNESPHIVAHNMETVPRLYRRVRPDATYQRSLDVLLQIAESRAVSKTGLMLGLGETADEVEAVMYDLREVGCEILSLGQYLSPTTRHLAVERWVNPDTFARLASVGQAMGFRHVESGPMVRSSYMAHRAFEL
jgi:lipoic acid synthetase